MNIIQQLQDLKEWSQNRSRYERRMNFRNGQLVQPARRSYDAGGAVKVLNYLDSLPEGTEIGMEEIMEWANTNKAEVNPKNIYSALKDPDAMQDFKGGKAHVYGKERRDLLKSINKKIKFQVADKSPVVKDQVIKAYNDFLKKNNKLPRANELLKDVGHLYKSDRSQKILNITKTLRNAGLEWEQGAGLKYTSESEKERLKKQRRVDKMKKFSDLDVEKAIAGKQFNKSLIDKHHMNSLRHNVNLRNIAYIPRDVNYGVLMRVEGNIGNQYKKRDSILKKRPPNWKKELNNINTELRDLIGKKLPQKYRGLLNIEILEPDAKGKLKLTSEGMDWTLSAGKEAGELGKIDFKKMNLSQKAKAIKIAQEQLDTVGKSTMSLGFKGGLGKTFRTLGTPLAGPAFAGLNVYDKMKQGKSLADAVVDPLTGIELAIPGMFKENLAKITKNPRLMKLLSLGYKIPKTARTIGSLTTPIGWALTAAGLAKEGYNVLKEDKVRRESITPEQKRDAQEIEFDEDFMAAGGGIAGIRRPNAIPPASGPDPQGLASMNNYATKRTE